MLRKEPRGRRTASDMTMRNDIEALCIGDDNQFRGLVAPSTLGTEIPVATHVEGGVPLTEAQILMVEVEVQAREAHDNSEEESIMLGAKISSKNSI